MRRTLMMAALVLSSASSAFATSHYETTYYDTIRPNGQPRSQAVYDAALNDCYSQTGAPRNSNDPPAFRACMASHGYRWMSVKDVPDAPTRLGGSAANLQPGDTFIDPENGMSCHNEGIAEICVPPQGTVHYTNKHGLNCTRTGLAAICTSF
jgi:hypothetical protein